MLHLTGMKRIVLVVVIVLAGFLVHSVDASSEEDAIIDVITGYYKALAQGNIEKAISYLSKDFSAGPLNYAMFVNAMRSPLLKKQEGIDPSLCMTIKKITIDEDKATVVVMKKGEKETYFLKKEDTGWKIVEMPVKVKAASASTSSSVQTRYEMRISFEVSSKEEDLRRFEGKKSSISAADIENIKRLLERYVQAIERKDEKELLSCFSLDFCVSTEELVNTGLVIDYNFLKSYLPYELLNIKEIDISNISIKGEGNKAEIRFTESTKKKNGERLERVKIFTLKEDTGLWKIVSIPIELKLIKEEKAPAKVPEREVIKISLKGLEKLKDNLSFVYYPKGKEAIAKELLHFMVKTSKTIKEKLGFEPNPLGVVLHNYAQPINCEIKTAESTLDEGVVFPIRMEGDLFEDKNQLVTWIIPHEQTEMAVILKLGGLYAFAPYTRWIGDGIAEYLGYTVSKGFSRKQCKARLTELAERLQSLMNRRTTYDLTQWKAPSSSSISEGVYFGEEQRFSTAGYAASLSFWLGLIDRHGEGIVKDFLEKGSKLSTINNKNLIVVLSEVCGEKDLLKQLSTADIASLKHRLDVKIQELEIEEQ